MIHILDKYRCCGCEACCSVCPRQCITMETDDEGFLYPVADIQKCIDCGLCDRVCPVIHKRKNETIPDVFAAISNNESIRLQSSSGGIFTLLAEYILDKGGVVFGACFNEEWEVVHDYTEDKDGLSRFRGSKYVQSRIGDNFHKVKNFLDVGREVLFSGTPCQISGLKRYLRKSYNNLLTIEVVCHGVPSPKVWKNYLREKGDVCSVDFRNKHYGWKNYHVMFRFSNKKNDETVFWKNHYMDVFLSDLSLRPSCYKCAVKSESSQCDIALADFWGIEKVAPHLDDDKGCGIVLLYNKEKQTLLQKLDCRLSTQKFEDVSKYNPCITNSVIEPINRKFFFSVINIFRFNKAYRFTTDMSLMFRLLRKLYRLL